MISSIDMTNLQTIGRPQEGEFAPYAKTYVDHVYSDDLDQVLTEQVRKTIELVRPLGDEGSLFAYAPGKWTVKQVIGHVTDAERIFSYRVLRIARGDKTPLPGFEQDDYVPNAGSNRRLLDELLDEFSVVRESTLALLRGINLESWGRIGTVSGFPATVLGISFLIAGHDLHLFKVLWDVDVRVAGPASHTQHP
jgi:hypothetical protein